MLRTVTLAELRLLLEGAAATFLRVNAALLISAAWTVPVGVAIGFNPKIARIVQPVAQVLASVPATAFFPILLIGLVQIGGGLGIGSIALMLLGTQWYILFNVIAGAMSIPSDLREVASLYRFTRWQRWTRLILPGIFPYLITGMVTASAERGTRRFLPSIRMWLTGHCRPSAWAPRLTQQPITAGFRFCCWRRF